MFGGKWLPINTQTGPDRCPTENVCWLQSRTGQLEIRSVGQPKSSTHTQQSVQCICPVIRPMHLSNVSTPHLLHYETKSMRNEMETHNSWIHYIQRFSQHHGLSRFSSEVSTEFISTKHRNPSIQHFPLVIHPPTAVLRIQPFSS